MSSPTCSCEPATWPSTSDPARRRKGKGAPALPVLVRHPVIVGPGDAAAEATAVCLATSGLRFVKPPLVAGRRSSSG